MSAVRAISLRRRLALLLLGGTLVCWVVVLGFSYRDAHHEIDELFDAQLAQAAQTLLVIARHGDDDVSEDTAEVAHKYQRRLRFQIWNHEGRLLLHSPNAPVAPLTTQEGFSEYNRNGEHWRYFSQWDPQRQMQVQVAENHDIRDELVSHIARRLLLPLLIGLPVLALWVWLAIGRGLGPVRAVTAQIEQRHPEHLQPLEPEAVPQEIRPLVEALNALLHQVEQALENERRFTADAAHELRTPLAALHAQLQVAQRTTDDAERQRVLARLHEGVERSTHLIGQLLTLARLDPADVKVQHEAVDIGAIAQTVCAELGAQAMEKRQTLELEAADDVMVTGDGGMLSILLRNLVDNAIRYTPPAGRITVRVVKQGSCMRLEVSDSGPGIPPADREGVFQRFHRLAGQAVSGSGLGLSIAQRVAELHGTAITLAAGADGKGLSARVDLAAAPRSSQAEKKMLS